MSSPALRPAAGRARSIAGAMGLAAAAGAAQLGVGYGLGIITWFQESGGPTVAVPRASLAWATWVAATSTVAGAVWAGRLGQSRRVRLPAEPAPTPSARQATAKASPVPEHEGGPRPVTGMWRFLLAFFAAVGALVTVAVLAVLPASAATAELTRAAAGHVIGGVAVGLFVAVWALSSRAAAANVVLTIAWLWVLAAVAVAENIGSDREIPVRLDAWPATGGFRFHGYLYWPAGGITLGSALFFGMLAAILAPARLRARPAAALSGGAGPLLATAAYVLTAPRLPDLRPEQLSVHLLAPYAILAGIAGSALIAVLPAAARRAHRPASEQAPTVGPAAAIEGSAKSAKPARPPKQREPSSSAESAEQPAPAVKQTRRPKRATRTAPTEDA